MSVQDKTVKLFQTICKYMINNKLKSSTLSIALLFISRYIYHKLRHRIYQYPPGPIGLPLVGSLFSRLPGTFLSMPNFHIHLAKTYGPVSMFQYGPLGLTVLISDCKIAKQILRQKHVLHRRASKSTQESILHIGAADDYKTKALLMISHENWARRRKLLQNTILKYLTNRVLNNVMNDCLNNAVVPYLQDIINKNKTWKCEEIIKYVTFNTIYVSTMGKTDTIKLDDDIYKNITEKVDDSLPMVIMSRFLLAIKYPKYLMPTLYDKYMNWKRERNGLFKDFVLSKLNAKNDKNDKNDETLFVLDAFVKAIKNKEMTLEEAYVDLFLLFFAGVHTTTHTAGFGVALIAKNDKNGLMEQIRNELLNVMKQRNKDTNTIKLDLHKVNECPLFRAFIYEIMRISSMVQMGVPHMSDKDIWIQTDDGKRYYIPKGIAIYYNIDYIQRYSKMEQERYWKAGIDDNIHLKNWLKKYENNDKYYFVKNEGFINFGTGKRDCVGKTIAIKELYAFLGFIILNYTLSLDHDNQINCDELRIGRKSDGATVRVYPELNVKIKRIQYD